MDLSLNRSKLCLDSFDTVYRSLSCGQSYKQS